MSARFYTSRIFCYRIVIATVVRFMNLSAFSLRPRTFIDTKIENPLKLNKKREYMYKTDI